MLESYHSSIFFIYTEYMGRERMIQELQELLTNSEASILYEPLEGEVDYNDLSFPLRIPTNNVVLPQTKDSDPFSWATTCCTRFKNTKPYILIPGTTFDTRGTRHGKGGGWYDRFLSSVPQTWLKIGIAYDSQISFSPLKREPWDVPVDYVLVRTSSTWIAYKT